MRRRSAQALPQVRAGLEAIYRHLGGTGVDARARRVHGGAAILKLTAGPQPQGLVGRCPPPSPFGARTCKSVLDNSTFMACGSMPTRCGISRAGRA
jgi:hypothetical protein